MTGLRVALCPLVAAGAIVAAALPIAAGAGDGGPAMVRGVGVVTPTGIPESLVREAIGEMVGRPRSRRAVRESLERLWSLGLFADVQVEEVEALDGVSLRYRLTPRPLVHRIAWRGDAGLDLAQLAGAAALAIGEEASPERLARVRSDILALYRREGFLGASVDVGTAGDDVAREVTVDLAAGTPARYAEVCLEGTLGLPPEVAARALGLGAGDRYREAAVRDGVRALEERLRRDGFFEAHVAARPPSWDRATNRVRLAVDVAAGRRYDVTFTGRHALAESALRRRLTVADSGVVDDFEVEASARQLEAAYREQGYAFARVAGALDSAAEPPALRFDVAEGPEVRVASVTVRGQAALPTARLEAAIATRPPALGRKGLFRQDVLDRDLAALQALARAEGFSDVRVGPAEVRFEDGGSQAHVVVPIVEGPRVTVSRVAVEGQTLVAEPELLAVVAIRPGDPWNPARVEDGRRAIEELYGRRGYHGATADTAVTRRDAEVSILFRLVEGRPTRIAQVRLRGLVLTKEATVRRQLGFGPGDRFDPDRLLAAQRRLERSPALASVDVGPRRPAPAPFADVDVTVAEHRPWRLELGAGYDTAEGARGYVELAHDNLFGTARSASVRIKEAVGGQAVKRLDRFDVVYREPWVAGTDWQAEAELFGERSENLGYDLARLGFAAWIGDDLLNPREPRILRYQLRYRIEGVRTSNVSPDLEAQDIEAGTQRVASLTPVAVWDFRDDRFNPRRGSVHRLSLEVAHDVLGGDVEFVKGELATAWFFSWLPPTVLALSGRLGLATPFGRTDSLPIEDRFFAGGSTSVRGFPENQLGPRDAAGNPIGGNALVVLSAEWRFPLWGWLGGAVFVDAGAVTPEIGDLNGSAFRAGAGAGLRLATPVGPIRLDAAYALRPISGETRFQVYLTVGYPF
jgi:outer membrane protein insertion porin family